MWPQIQLSNPPLELRVADHQETRPGVETQLEQVIELLHRHELVENLVRRQAGARHDLVETLVHRQHLTALQQLLDRLHPADIAYVLEALPLDQRLAVWDLVKAAGMVVSGPIQKNAMLFRVFIRHPVYFQHKGAGDAGVRHAVSHKCRIGTA